jgi:hypothetical protein
MTEKVGNVLNLFNCLAALRQAQGPQIDKLRDRKSTSSGTANRQAQGPQIDKLRDRKSTSSGTANRQLRDRKSTGSGTGY